MTLALLVSGMELSYATQIVLVTIVTCQFWTDSYGAVSYAWRIYLVSK